MHISLVDENLLLIDALKVLLEALPEVTEVSLFSNGKDFLKLHKDSPPDMAILNYALSGIGGSDLLDTCRAQLPGSVKILALTYITDLHTIKNTIRRGANGVVSSATTFQELKEAISQISKGNQYVGISLRDNLINSVFTDEVVLHLSPREKEVLQKVCGGSTIKEIAYDLRLSAHTVQYYHRNVMEKLKVKRTTDLIVYAIQHKLYIPESK